MKTLALKKAKWNLYPVCTELGFKLKNIIITNVPGSFGKLLQRLLLSILIISGTYSAQAQTGFSAKSVKASIQGTSTLHSWESAITKMEFTGSEKREGNTLTTISNGEVKIPVTGIISKKGRTMDNKTYKTFKSAKNPFITFTFKNADVKIDAAKEATVEVSGVLAMAGINKTITLDGKGKMMPNGDLQLSISKQLKMTDFKMKPPVMFLGTIKVGDAITVNFDFVLAHTT